MKKIIYTLAILLLATVASNAQYTRTFEIKNGDASASMKLYKDGSRVADVNTAGTVITADPVSYSNTTKMMFLDENVADYRIGFRTRLHPIYDNNSDTARTLMSRSNPKEGWPLGDVRIPQVIGDGTPGGVAFIQNGFGQFVEPLSSYFPELSDGVMTIDTVTFYAYPEEGNPISNDFFFALQKLTLPSLGTDTFRGAELSYNDIWDNIPDALTLSASELNSKLVDNSIKPTIIDFTNPNLSDGMKNMRDYKSNEPFLFMLTKDDMNDSKDSLNLIGAWEWGLPKNQVLAHCLSAGINHYPTTNKDTISTSTTIYWTLKKEDIENLKVSYPALTAIADTGGRVFFRRNFNFLIIGRYTGAIKTTVNEVENGSNSFELSQNYPNPVMNSTNIKFSTKEFSRVTLNLYNSVGELVHMMVDREYAPGTYDVNFNASDLQSGTYFYTMTIGSFSKTLPMTIAR